MAKNKTITRFGLPERIEHLVLMLSFTGLGLTGIPQKFAQTGWGESMIFMMGGIETVRIIHRICAVLMMAGAIYHGGSVTYKILVLRQPLYMLPGIQDLKDLVDVMKYNLGFQAEHPKMGRFNFEEKLEYWAVIWGTVVMVITGFMLWNPIATSQWSEGSIIPAAKAAHGGEALLAVLAIIIWHFYNVLTHGNFSIFTGKVRRKFVEHKHGLELEAIESGNVPEPPSPELHRKRMRVFLPLAVVMTIILVGFLIWFVTFEQTAITTLPQVSP